MTSALNTPFGSPAGGLGKSSPMLILSGMGSPLVQIFALSVLVYAGTQPPFNPIILPLFPDLVFPLNQLTNPLIFLAVVSTVGGRARNAPKRCNESSGTGVSGW